MERRKRRTERAAIFRVAFPEVGVKSISRHIVDQILDKLFTGKLHPGDFLGTEQELAVAFGSSRPPVREALGRLDALGVVTVTTGVDGGARVAEADPDRIAGLLAIHFVLANIAHGELLDARAAIEPQAFELAAKRVTAADLTVVRDHLEQARTAMTSTPRDIRGACEALSRLHRALGDICHNMVLIGLMRVIERNLFYRYLELRDPQILSIGLNYFERVIEQLERGDGERAAQLAREHLAEHRLVFKT